MAVLVDRVTPGFAIDSQGLVVGRILGIPALQGKVECRRVEADEPVAEAGAAGDFVAAIAIAAAKARTDLLAQVFGPNRSTVRVYKV
ncbi:MAG: hypothetical protein ACFCVA_03170 [Gammaproteobacteria bacterium]